MNDQSIIGELTLLRSHANELATIADNILKKLTITSATRKKGLSDQQMATLIAAKNKKRIP